MMSRMMLIKMNRYHALAAPHIVRFLLSALLTWLAADAVNIKINLISSPAVVVSFKSTVDSVTLHYETNASLACRCEKHVKKRGMDKQDKRSPSLSFYFAICN
eukprot:GHVU01036239.1.p2 GENE.GHVU01036239.1~~GHVU01036239.1.p2  ORF type:complete len:103 (-),score=7.15 GHVU01036239.1:711-1019(-)